MRLLKMNLLNLPEAQRDVRWVTGLVGSYVGGKLGKLNVEDMEEERVFGKFWFIGFLKSTLPCFFPPPFFFI